MPECVICGAEVTLNRDAVKGELVECKECGTELEVVSTDPVALAEAPKEEEDWGQ
jgi:alpha-aminoadipate carrier protein LysW